VLAKIRNADQLLMPADNMTSELKDVEPVITAHFVFEQHEKTTVQLEVEMAGNSGLNDGLYERVHALWSRFDRKDNQSLLDCSMSRLGGHVFISTRNTILY